MVSQPIPVAPGDFKAGREEPEQILDVTEEIRPAQEHVSVVTGVGHHTETATARQTRVNPPVQCLLTVEHGSEKTSLTLPLRSTPVDPPNVYDLETPGTVQGLRIGMRVSATEQGTFQLDADYSGLEVGRALSYARFVDALKNGEGRFTIAAYVNGGAPKHLVSIDLPLPFDQDERERSRQELRFWEALHEVSKETGKRLVCPPEISEEDLRNLNTVLAVVQNGCIVERVRDFTIPPAQEAAENFVRMVEQEGDVLRALALVTEHETYEIFGVGINLGMCTRYIAKARLLTPLDEIRKWVASDPEQRETLFTRWEPADGAQLHMMFPEWPKPSLDRVRNDLKAFEDEYRMETDDFRRAWEAEDQEVRAIEDGDIWFTLSDIERALAKRD